MRIKIDNSEFDALDTAVPACPRCGHGLAVIVVATIASRGPSSDGQYHALLEPVQVHLRCDSECSFEDVINLVEPPSPGRTVEA